MSEPEHTQSFLNRYIIALKNCMIQVIKIQIEPVHQGQRLDVFLAKNLQELSRSRIKVLIAEGYVAVDGKNSQPKYKLKGNELIKVIIPEPKETSLQPENIDLDIIFADDDIIVINKPAGMVVHPGAGHYSGTLVNALLYHFPKIAIGGAERPGIVHRLDKETSGVMVCAQNDLSHQVLINNFRNRDVEKLYHAFCVGVFKNVSFELETGHRRHQINRKKFTTRLDPPKEDGGTIRRAHSKFTILNSKDGVSEVLVELLTGRTHQIRAQLADIGHPILTDALYGGLKRLKNLKESSVRDAALKLTRHALHAQKLVLVQAKTQKRMEFEAPLPDDLQILKESLVDLE